MDGGDALSTWKILLSGHAPEYAYERGCLDQRVPFTELRRRSHINAVAQAADQAPDFSRRIRAQVHGPREAHEARPMPIKSYLVYPARGRRDELAAALRALAGCEVVPAANRDLLVVVTDTPDAAAEEALQRALALVPGIEGLALVAGVDDAGARAPGVGE